MTQVIVLGMHRSGTSMIAGVLHKLGVSMGDDLVLGEMEENPGGYYEDREFIHINEHILTQAGGGWFTLPDPELIEGQAGLFQKQIRALIKKRNAQHQFWGWKDPRTALTLPCFLPYLSSPKIVVVRREKESVIKSLVKREKGTMTERAADALYTEYHIRIVQSAARVGYAVVHYEDGLRWPPALVRRLIKICKISPTAQQIAEATEHIRPELRRC